MLQTDKLHKLIFQIIIHLSIIKLMMHTFKHEQQLLLELDIKLLINQQLICHNLFQVM